VRVSRMGCLRLGAGSERMRMRNAAITTAAGAAVVVLAVAAGVAGSHSARPGGSPAAGMAGSPAARSAGGNFPQYTLTGVSCASTTACTAVGGTYYAHEVAPAVLRWNGTTWSVQHAPNPPEHGGSVLTAVSCSRPDDCIAVGKRGGYQMGTLAEHWNGKTWSVQPTPMSSTESSELNGVSCSSPAACMAVGDRLVTKPEVKQVTVAMRWNGKAWAVQSTPNSPTAESVLFSVSCPAATAGPTLCWPNGGTAPPGPSPPPREPPGAAGGSRAGVRRKIADSAMRGGRIHSKSARLARQSPSTRPAPGQPAASVLRRHGGHERAVQNDLQAHR
jgi:hypothetical protein